MERSDKKTKEPVFLVKPALKNFGLDYLHISLLVLVVILALFSYSLSAFKPGVKLTNCQYGLTNGTCTQLSHNSTQVLAAERRILASYTSINSSLSLLPYYALTNRSAISYLATSDQWLVVVPYVNPLQNNSIQNFSMVLYNSNLTLATPYLPAIRPLSYTNNSAVALGSIALASKAACTQSKPVPVYLITDPYAPGSVRSLYAAVNATKSYGSSIAMNYYFVFTQYAIKYYSGFTPGGVQLNGQYLSCASRQRNFSTFLNNYNIAYNGRPLSNQTLYQIEQSSNMNVTKFNTCMANVTASLNNQALFAGYYNLSTTPAFIVNCKYLALPQTLNYSIKWALGNLAK